MFSLKLHCILMMQRSKLHYLLGQDEACNAFLVLPTLQVTVFKILYSKNTSTAPTPLQLFHLHMAKKLLLLFSYKLGNYDSKDP